MVRIKEIQKSFRTLVGWRQSVDARTSVDAALTVSESGLYYQDAHPMLTTEAIRAIMPDPTGVEYAEWNALRKYTEGIVVQYNEKLYICREECSGEVPKKSGSWDKYDRVDEYIRTLIDAATAKVVSKFIETKTESRGTKTLLENKMLYNAGGLLNNIIADKESRLVGWMIQPRYKHKGVTVRINAIGTQTKGATGNITLYVFHSSQPAPMRTLSLKITKDGFAKFNIDDLMLPYDGEEINAGGKWFICYKQDELPFGMSAININHDWSSQPCPTCGRVNANTWNTLSRYMDIMPFFVDVESSFSTSPEMFDMEDMVTTPYSCYGINMEFTVECDLTDFIISQRSIFATVLQNQLCYDALKALAYNPNANVERVLQNATRQDIVLELDGNTYTRSGGILSRIEKAYKTLEIDTGDMDSACVACNKVGVRIGIA